mmetsp:Transcript_115948/g.322893  ORF Transcript_115948/g.322893 Transcript_115948/m.322893 type:complete len:660 (-) Transcript_115948:306-2285(-)
MDASMTKIGITMGQMKADSIAEMLISIQPPEEGDRQPSDIVCIIDISGSMGMEATIVGASGNSESHGLSLLDVAKHGVRTIASALTDKDRLAVVAFNHMSRVIFPLTVMDEAGRKMAEEKLDELMQAGGTNIWDGLESGLECLRTAQQLPTRFGHVMLLTDGESQSRDAIIPNLLQYKEKYERLPGSINTFGFGYNLDSQLLVGLADAGMGSYSFIPDAGFVGTAFVNMMSQLLVTMAQEVTVSIEVEPGLELMADSAHGGWKIQKKTGFFTASLGSLQFGQSKDIVVPVKVTSPDAAGEIVANATFKTNMRTEVKLEHASAKVQGKVDNEANLLVEEHVCRSKFVEALLKVRDVVDRQRNNVDDGLKLITGVAEAIKASPAANTEKVQALLEDVQGQSTEAVSRQDWYWRWGIHYLPSVMFAHKLQICNNFKDPGVQGYGGKLFSVLRDEADDIFCKLPAPKPTARSWSRPHTPSSAAPVSMAAYHDAFAGCVDGSSLVQLVGGTQCQLSQLVKGSRVLAPSGAEAEVVCLARTPVDGGRLQLVELPGGLRLTPYHPVLLDGEWLFPADLAMPMELPCEAVYSFVLRGAPAMYVGGTPCVALGHGLEEGAAKHPYFAAQQAVEDLKKFPGFESGLVELSQGSAVRDPDTGLVCGLALP